MSAFTAEVSFVDSFCIYEMILFPLRALMFQNCCAGKSTVVKTIDPKITKNNTQKLLHLISGCPSKTYLANESVSLGRFSLPTNKIVM